MDDKIKKALLALAENIIKDHSQWDNQQLHQAIQKLYELSICQKFFSEEKSHKTDLWERHQAALSSVIENLTGPLSSTASDQTEDLEVPPMMETIKNMVTEMPESDQYDRLFETIEEPPIFIPKQEDAPSEAPKVSKSKSLSGIEERKSLNDKFAQELTIDLNDRLAFIKHLFEENTRAYEAVLAQIVTYSSWEEVREFIINKVKIEYPHWKEKESVEARFMKTLEQNFNK